MFQPQTLGKNYSILQIERFSNNHGSSLTEVILLSQIPVILNYVSVGLILSLPSTFRRENVFFRFTFEFFVIIFPLIILLTVASHLLLIFCTSFICLSCIIFAREDYRRSWTSLRKSIITDEKLSCVTVARATVNLFTVICILSADFNCFPRRFLKTETHGYGLMDTGVGLFIIINSLTDSPSKSGRSVLYSANKILPFVVLGLGRYFSTSALNYHYQITEYGTQWNFFLTLSAITLFNEILFRCVRSIATIGISTVILLVIHESSLLLGLESWIVSDAPRQNFISGNREGLFSLLGYEILYLCGMMTGYFLPKKNDSFQKYVGKLPRYAIGFLLSLTLTKLAEFSFGVSRRTANVGYIFWILSITFLSLMNTIVCDIALRISTFREAKNVNSASLIMRAVNYNGFLFFLLGNLLTGFINMSTKTLLMDDKLSIFIIIVYAFICCVCNVFLYRKNKRYR